MRPFVARAEHKPARSIICALTTNSGPGSRQMATSIVKNSMRTLCVAASFIWASAAIAQTTVYNATLTGPNESPPNASTGTGTATVTIDTSANTMLVSVAFSGLSAPTTASHIHAATASPFTGTAGVATQTPFFTGFPIGVTSGSYSSLFDLLTASTYNSSYVTANGGTAAGAEAALLTALNGGRAYLNIHTSAFPGGEIRGFLVAVPEADTWMMMLLGFGAIGVVIRRRGRSLASA